MARKRHVVIVTHTRLRESGTVVSQTVDQLEKVGFDVAIIDNSTPLEFGAKSQSVPSETEIVVVLGGDGTMLRAAELVHCTGVPLLGINMGHVGFLAEFESFQLREAIRRVADKDYQIEQRLLAHTDVSLPGHDAILSDWALNEVTVERLDREKMVELAVSVDNVEVSSFSCDGIIASTPTGSTAYGFSSGGPIVWPDVQALQLVPLAAHAMFARPLIIGSSSTFTMDILENSASKGWICCDGRRQRALPRGSQVRVRASKDTMHLVRLSEVPFTKRLVTKFNLPVVGWREKAEAEQEAFLEHGGFVNSHHRGPSQDMTGAAPGR